MSAQTSRYGIKYPTGGDLVSDIPQHMQQAAQSIETALANVDDRHTTAAYSPVVRTTKYLLDQATRQPGQVGIVTAEPNAKYNHYYIAGVDRAWHRIYTDDKANDIVNVAPLKIHTTTVHVPYTAPENVMTLQRVGQLVTVQGHAKFELNSYQSYTKVGEIIPAGYRPATNGIANIVFVGQGYVSLAVEKDGSMSILGNPQNGYARASACWFTADTQER